MKKSCNDQVILIHCFHTKEFGEMNMRAIPYMKKAFDSLVGYSAADRNDEMDIVAISLGAVIVEKRLTLRRDLPGHHHVLSKEPKEFKEYVKLMRNVHASLGTYDLRPSAGDLEVRQIGFRHIVANEDIRKGTKLTAEMLEGKRPEIGVSPEYMDFFIGRTVKRNLKENEALSFDDV
jgi:N,N'-diacetyllegionaminate synthase